MRLVITHWVTYHINTHIQCNHFIWAWFCFFSFKDRITSRHSVTKTQGRGCVSVPLRVPRPGQNVGKVAQCLSHDPWEEAFFLLGPWLEMTCHRKPKTSNTSTRFNIEYMSRLWDTSSHCPCLPAHNRLNAVLTERVIHKFLYSRIYTSVHIRSSPSNKPHFVHNCSCSPYVTFPQFISHSD